MELSPDLQQLLAQAATPFEKVDLLNLHANSLFMQEDLEAARYLAEQARQMAGRPGENQPPYYRGLAVSLVTLGDIGLYICPYAETLSLYLEAQAILEQNDDPISLIRALMGISWVYFSSGDYPAAQSYIDRAISVCETNMEMNYLGQALNTAGAIQGETNPELAVGTLQRSIDIYREMDNAKDQAIAYNNLGMVLISQNKLSEAESAALIGLKLIQTVNTPITESSVLDTLGLVYAGQEKLELAAQYYQKAVERVKALQVPLLELEPGLHLGDILLKKGDFEAAHDCLANALQTAEENGASRIVFLCHEKLATYYETVGDFQQGLTHYRQFHQLKEKVHSQEAMQKIADLTALHKVETAQKDSEILRLRNALLVQEIEEERKHHAELEFQATTDPLTGLFNRRHFFTLGAFEFNSAHHNHLPLSLIMLDVDHFKTVNDQFGHPIGDRVLVELSNLLISSIRREDVCCRYGGEEFVILLPNSDPKISLAIAERLRKEISEMQVQVLAGGAGIQITVSVGVASLQLEDPGLDQLIQRADQALFMAKSAGRNMVLALP